MGEVVTFKPKPVCTNIHTTCTHDDCPLKAEYKRLGDGYYLGNCAAYLIEKHFKRQQPQD